MASRGSEESTFTLPSVAKEYLAGAISGLGKVGAGHPFDTIKSRVQAGRFATPREALVRTVRDEGPLALYQGCSMPTVNVCFVGGIVFSTNSAIKAWLQPDPNIRLTYKEMFIAGCGAGVVTGFAANPIEIIKVHLQVTNRKAAVDGTTAAAAAEKTIVPLIRRVGIRQLLGCGLDVTIIREIGTFGVFFPLNEYLKELMVVARDGNNKNLGSPLPVSMRVVAAWVAGVVCWFPCYPIDVVKTRIQHARATMEPGSKPLYSGALHCAQVLYKQEGGAVFWRGLSPCLLRAGPAYSAQYILYEFASARLKGQ